MLTPKPLAELTATADLLFQAVCADQPAKALTIAHHLTADLHSRIAYYSKYKPKTPKP